MEVHYHLRHLHSVELEVVMKHAILPDRQPPFLI